MSSNTGSMMRTNSKIRIGQAQVAVKVKTLEQILKNKLSSNFNSVRKAWLELDDNHKGYITVEELAKFLSGGV